MLEDIMYGVEVEMLDAPIAITATLTGSTCDLKGYEGVKFAASFGASGDTISGSVYWTGKLQESDASSSGFTDVADADVTGPATNVFALVDDPADVDTVYCIGYRGIKRYVRVVITKTGTHNNGTVVGINAIKIPVDRPVTQEVTP